jgi:hypothetical protein
MIQIQYSRSPGCTRLPMFEGPATGVGEDGVDVRRGAEELALGPGLISSPESMILSSGIINIVIRI